MSPVHNLSAGAQGNTLRLDARAGNFLPVKCILFFHFLGGVQSGRLREAFEEYDPEDHWPVSDETYNGAEFGLRVRGDLLDEIFPEDTVLFCLPFDEEIEELLLGKYVVAVTSSKQTDQIETTVKNCA